MGLRTHGVLLPSPTPLDPRAPSFTHALHPVLPPPSLPLHARSLTSLPSLPPPSSHLPPLHPRLPSPSPPLQPRPPSPSPPLHAQGAVSRPDWKMVKNKAWRAERRPSLFVSRVSPLFSFLRSAFFFLIIRLLYPPFPTRAITHVA